MHLSSNSILSHVWPVMRGVHKPCVKTQCGYKCCKARHIDDVNARPCNQKAHRVERQKNIPQMQTEEVQVEEVQVEEVQFMEEVQLDAETNAMGANTAEG